MTAVTDPVNVPAGMAPAEPAGRALCAPRLALLRVPPWAGLLLVVSLWLIARPYRGVRHDGILYLGQILGRLLPDSIGQDLFLVHGSQDRYSIYSWLMAPLVHWLGVGVSQVVVLAACEMLFVLGCWLLTADIGSRVLRWAALLALVAVSHIYGCSLMVGFAEPFLTARAMSEPLLVLGLVCMLRAKPGAALALMAAGAAVHPLIALPVIVTAWVYRVLGDRRWLWALLVVLLPAAAGAFGVAPFSSLWQRYDAEWWRVTAAANPDVFLTSAGIRDLVPTFLDIGLLVMAARMLGRSALSRLIQAALACAVLFTVLWGVGADLLHDVLLTQLQLWRAYWVTHLLATLVLPFVLITVWDQGDVGRWGAASIALAAVAASGNLTTGWLCLIWALLPLIVLRTRSPVSRAVVNIAIAASVIGMIGVTLIVARGTFGVAAAMTDRFNGVGSAQIVLGLTVCSALVGGALLRGICGTGLWRLASMVGVIVLVAVALQGWDQRSDWQRELEEGLDNPHPAFAGLIPPSATVYWEDSLIEPWTLIQRPQFYQGEQGAGSLFNRQTALEVEQRRRVMAPLEVQKAVCQTVAAITNANSSASTGYDTAECAPTPADIQAFCKTPNAPEFLVFRASTADTVPGVTATWTFHSGDAKTSRTYRLYDCAKLSAR
jgi:hypothetical protein